MRKGLIYFIWWWKLHKMYLLCLFWEIRGLKTCKKHGFHAQDWINGHCKKCWLEDQEICNADNVYGFVR